ncbi:MAG: PASTA domain-containing protein, partial [Clostridia bacterium]|nr:PASTA domain-containing protein [Clostridia bacterium]
AALVATGLGGMYFSRDISRFYPYGNFLSGAMGFCNADVLGQTGLELYYNDYLKGLNGYQLTNTDIRGVRLDGAVSYIPSVDGFDLVLTIDKSIQYFAESAVQNALLQYQAKQAACIVMDARTGGIAALAQAPSFDLNAVPRDDLDALFAMCKIGAVSDVHEMGSTFKILTMAIAINEGLVDLDDRFYCAGSREVDGQRIKCWKTKGHGSQTFAEAVQNSCNCAFMDLALRVGVEKMYSYFRAFGLTSKSGIDVAGETSGLLLPEESVKTVDLARIGFGQAIAITPIGLIRAVTACINGGLLLTPHVMDHVQDYTGKLVETTYVQATRVLTPETSALVRQLLLGVVQNGSGRLAGVEGYAIGCKTGTAQKYKDGSIDRGKYLSSFIGFCTADDPRYVVFLYVDEPQGYLYYGSQVAAPYVGSIFANLLSYIGEPKAESTPKSTFVMPDFAGMTYAQVLARCKAMGLYLEASGDGSRVTYQFPVAGAECSEGCVLLVDLS